MAAWPIKGPARLLGRLGVRLRSFLTARGLRYRPPLRSLRDNEGAETHGRRGTASCLQRNAGIAAA